MEENGKDLNEEILNTLTVLNSNSSETNDRLKELQEYFIAKDRAEKQKEETETKQAAEDAKLQAELEEQEQKEKDSAEAEATAKAEAQEQTYTEQLQNINDQLELSNQIGIVNGIYIAIVIGLLFMKVLFDRIFK